MKKIGNYLIIISLILLCLSMPLSMAGDNIAAATGIVGFCLVIISQNYRFPPIKPLIYLLTPEFLSSILNNYICRIFDTDLKQHLMPYFLTYHAFKDEKQILKFLYITSVSTVISVFGVLFQAFTWQNLKHLNLKNLGFHTAIIRANGFLNHPLTTAGVLYLLMLLFIWSYTRFRKKWFLTVSILCFIGIVFTQSRSYWVGSGVFTLCTLIFLRSKRIIVTTTLGLATLGLLFLGFPQIRNRFISIENTRRNWENVDRIMLWDANSKAFLYDYSLKQKLFGSGYDAESFAWKEFGKSYLEVTKDRKLPSKKFLELHFHHGLTHNIYLKYLTKYGIVGLLGFLLFWASILRLNIRKISRADIKILTSGYIGFLSAGFFENNFTDAEVKFVLMFIIGVNYLLINQYKDQTD